MVHLKKNVEDMCKIDNFLISNYKFGLNTTNLPLAELGMECCMVPGKYS